VLCYSPSTLGIDFLLPLGEEDIILDVVGEGCEGAAMMS
jgi:hypothetical protein